MSENWCHCVPPNGSSRGWTLDPARDLWVCSICRQPSKAIFLMMPSDPPMSDPSDRIMA
jgi:hypothetical protein